MVVLTDEQLARPDAVPPYRAFRDLIDVLLSRQALPTPARLLDIGAGVGAYGELLARWAPGCFLYVGADYSAEVVAAARARSPERTFVELDIFTPGALDGFDVVLASALLDVLADVEVALDALLAADSRFVLLHRQRIDATRTHVELAPGYRGQRTYRSYLTLRDLEDACARHGRRVVASEHVEGDVRSFLIERG